MNYFQNFSGKNAGEEERKYIPVKGFENMNSGANLNHFKKCQKIDDFLKW